MNLASFGPLSLTLFASLVIALVLLAIRIVVMQRVQQRRQRENRQETERLKSLVAAYRALAGSFSPATVENASQMEETLAEIVLFGSLPQVELAASCARALRRGESPDYQPLVEELRSDLRRQLGLDPIPDTLVLPVSGPGRSTRTGRGEGEGGGGRGGAGGGGGGGGGGAGAGGAAGGLGAGLIASEAMNG
ncbi:preprotein translocase subunit YajC [Hydrogenophaga sp.]|uniref:preprotein translocase subunit YajC n=1 Tax=Hydrogenophaga sp. TaxID=1904254 RepID=UPI002FCA8438